MTPEELLRLTDRLYEVSSVGDFDTAETMLADDLVIYEADSLPMAGEYRGKTALRNLYTHVMGIMDVVALERINTLVGDNQTVAIVRFKFADPSIPAAELAEVFTFRDGKVTEIKPYYFEPSLMHRAVAAKKAKENA